MHFKVLVLSVSVCDNGANGALWHTVDQYETEIADKCCM